MRKGLVSAVAVAATKLDKIKIPISSFTRYSMIMSDLWDQISEIADLNKVKHLLSLSRSP